MPKGYGPAGAGTYQNEGSGLVGRADNREMKLLLFSPSRFVLTHFLLLGFYVDGAKWEESGLGRESMKCSRETVNPLLLRFMIFGFN